jgi:hypothetical protein
MSKLWNQLVVYWRSKWFDLPGPVEGRVGIGKRLLPSITLRWEQRRANRR